MSDFPRREFLKVTTFGIVAGALNPGILSAARLLKRNPGGEPLLAIGFAENAPKAGESVALQSASSLLTGDPTFISRGVRLTFDSFSRAPKYRDQLAGGAAVDVIFPANSYTPDKLPRFRAWSFLGREDGDTASGPISFTVPVTATDGLQLVVRRTSREDVETAKNSPRGSATGDESAAPFIFGTDSRFAKLQRGVYVLAFRETVDDVVAGWSPFRLTNRNGALALNPVTVSHVVVSVDYAS
jgi:hypothetical protein